MKNTDRTAFPLDGDNTGHPDTVGINKREYFAGLAMQGLLANKYFQTYKEGKLFVDAVAKTSIEMADELLKQLDPK